MFSREDIECLDPGYFVIIYMDDRDVTIMSRNTRHMWYIHNPEYPLVGSCIIFYKHKVSHPYHQHGRSNTLRQAVRSIKRHGKYIFIQRSEWKVSFYELYCWKRDN